MVQFISQSHKYDESTVSFLLAFLLLVLQSVSLDDIYLDMLFQYISLS